MQREIQIKFRKSARLGWVPLATAGLHVFLFGLTGILYVFSATGATRRSFALTVHHRISGRSPGLGSRIRGDVRRLAARVVLPGCVGGSWNSLVVLPGIIDTGQGIAKSSIMQSGLRPTWPAAESARP